MVKAHVDGDVLVYEIGFAAEAAWKYFAQSKGEEPEGFPPFELVFDMLQERISYIIGQTEADESVIYLTGKQNFRNHVAFTVPYKTRAGNKPFHYKNIRAVLPTMFECEIVEGLEADDLIALNLGDGVAVSRDKDIRQLEGTHYSWELNSQPAIGPHKTDAFGSLELRKDKLLGYGDKFLYSQILTGDSVDSIPGCPNYGPKKAIKILENCTNTDECLEAIIPIYQKCYQLEWKSVLREQARLVYLARRFENGKVLLWDFPGEDETWMDVLSGQTYASPQDSEGGVLH